MAFGERRGALRAILKGPSCIRAGSVYDPMSIRIAEDLGFELGMFGGSVASLAIPKGSSYTPKPLPTLCETTRRMARRSALPVLKDADPGWSMVCSVRGTVQELETAGAAGLT